VYEERRRAYGRVISRMNSAVGGLDLEASQPRIAQSVNYVNLFINRYHSNDMGSNDRVHDAGPNSQGVGWKGFLAGKLAVGKREGCDDARFGKRPLQRVEVYGVREKFSSPGTGQCSLNH
jgi:hypothetical protein